MTISRMALLLAVIAPLLVGSRPAAPAPEAAFQRVRIPAWARDVTRMAYLSPSQLDEAAADGTQVIHTNVLWPYYPLRRDGGAPTPKEDRDLRGLVEGAHKRGIRVVLGLPPFPSVECIRAHPDWRVDRDGSGAILKVEPKENDLGTRLGCNVGPWGGYLIDICAELVKEYDLDGYSFDGNYASGICFCPYCKAAYKKDTGREIPPKPDLDTVEYRQYLVWRGEKLEDHYRRLQARIKAANPNAVLMGWTVNAGRYGHLLFSPRAHTTRMNLLFDLPMQEWWLDETNLGGSVAPAFGVAYLRAVVGDGPCAAEPYLMSRGSPYGTYSFPGHERIVRSLLATTYGALAPQSLGWPGHEGTTKQVFDEVRKREKWITHTRRLPWAAMLVSEQTRQFYAYKDIAGRYLPHVFGVFRAAMEEHLPLSLVNDWDLNPAELARYRVLVLPDAAALTDEQVKAVRESVRNGGGLVATCDTSRCDEIGRARPDFALADLFGVGYGGTLRTPQVRPELDANFAAHLDESYWRDRVGVATLTWTGHDLLKDPRLEALVPQKSVIFRGPELRVTEPKDPTEVIARMRPEGDEGAPLPAVIARSFGKGRVVYFAAGADAAMWSYSFPYQRRLLTRAIEWASGGQAPPVRVEGPMCVHATYFTQPAGNAQRVIVNLFNGLDTTADHGIPGQDVPLREEVVPIAGIRVRFNGPAPRSFHVEPGNIAPKVRREGSATLVEVPPLEVQSILVGEP